MIADALRRVRAVSGKSLRTVSDESGVAPSNLSAIENGHRDPTTATVERIGRALGVRFVPIPGERRTVAEHLGSILSEESAGHPDRAYREFIQLADDLASADILTKAILAFEAPAPSASRWADAVAGLTEFRLNEAGLPSPRWTAHVIGAPDDVWEPQRSRHPLPVQSDLAKAPDALRRRGIAIEAGELSSI